MESKDIIKALECCNRTGKNKSCKKCPLYTKNGCIDIIIKNALDLINRQQAEIERLKREKEISNSELAKAINKSLEQAKEIGYLKAEIERWEHLCQTKNKMIAELDKAFENVKTEAYKEFADRLKEIYRNNKTSITSLVILFTNINDLLQELTERKED